MEPKIYSYNMAYIIKTVLFRPVLHKSHFILKYIYFNNAKFLEVKG